MPIEEERHHLLWGLRNRLIAAFILTAIGPFLLLGHFFYQDMREETRALMVRTAEREAHQIATSIGIYLADYRETVEFLATEPILRQADLRLTTYWDKTGGINGMVLMTPGENGSGEAEVYRRLEEIRKFYPRVEFISFSLAETGGYVQSPATTRKAGYDPRKRDWYLLAAANPGKVMMTPPYLTSNGEALEISFVRTVEKNDREYAGVLSVDMTLKGLSGVIEDIRIGRKGYVVLADSENTIIAYPNRPDMLFKKLTMLGDEKSVGFFTEEKNGMLEEASRMIYLYSIPETGWKIIMVLDNDEFLQISEDVRQRIVFFAVGLACLGGICGCIAAYRIARPIRRVTRVAQLIAEGNLAASVEEKLESNRKDEVGMLIRSVAVMAERLQHYIRQTEELAKKQMEEENLRRHHMYLAMLHETAMILMKRTEKDEVLQVVMGRAAEMAGTSHGFMYVWDVLKNACTGRVELGVFFGEGGSGKTNGDEPVWDLCRQDQPTIVDDYYLWPDDALPGPGFKKAATVLQVPFSVGDRVRGILGVAYTEKGKAIHPGEVQMIRQFAGLAAIALDNAMLHDEWLYMENALRQSEANQRAVLDAIPDVLVRIDRQGTILDFRPGRAGDVPWKMDGNRNLEGVLGDDLAQMVRERLDNLSGQTEMVFSYSMSLSVPSEWEVRMGLGGENDVLIILRNVTLRRELEKKLVYLSERDALTGVYNRNYFEQMVHRQRADSQNLPGILVVDVDGLKLVNDTLGHGAGDALLRMTAEILLKAAGNSGKVFRVGGDEFIIFFDNTHLEQVKIVQDSIQRECDACQEKDGRIPVSLSVGIAVAERSGVQILGLYQLADDNMYKEKRQHSLELRGKMLRALGRRLLELDFIENGHGDRVEQMMLKWAASRKMGNEKQLQDFAKYHDIGKAGLDGELLRKPEVLTGGEYEEVKRHCEIGCRMVDNFAELTGIASWVLQHHEHWDGQGYPLGSKGEEIPLEARMLAIVDAYDVMTSGRPYRQKISREEAVTELRRVKGSQFQPELVEEFILLSSEWNT